MTNFNRLTSLLFNTQIYQTEARKEQARLLYILSFVLLIADILIVAVLPDVSGGSTVLIQTLNNGLSTDFLAAILLGITSIVVIILLRTGRYMFSAWLLNVMFLAAITLTTLSGTLSDFDFIALATVLLLATITLDTRGFAIIGGGSVVVYAISIFIPPPDVDVVATIQGLGAFLIYAAIVYSFMRLGEARSTEARLYESEERFKLAEINTSITRQASERASLDETMAKTLNLILENYPQIYHAQIFLIDDDNVQARLRASTGETGQQLINKGHSLAVGSLSVIGQTTFKGEPVIARSGDQESIHRQNELLPQTRVEVAFPLRIGNKIIGALDLQSRQDLELGSFDMQTFQSLANSLSLAIDSIRQFESAQAQVEENQRLAEQTRSALREVERLNQRLIGRAWSEYLAGKGDQLGLDFDLETSQSTPASEWTQSLKNAVETGIVIQDDNIISVPLRVRGVIVGAVEFELGEDAEFTPADMELVQEVSDRFGLAAENTRLVEESQRVAQRETLINEITSRLQSANNVEATLAEAARSLVETLQANKVAIRLGIPDKPSNRHKNGATE